MSDAEKILLDDTLDDVSGRLSRNEPLPALELAGPRERIFFDPAGTVCAIVTCGGLCPGLNDVIRGIVMQAHYRYGVPTVYGIRYGFEGFIPDYGHPVLTLTPDLVSTINRFGGSFLGTSRGPQEVSRIVDRLLELKVTILFVVGGDGTLRGARDISSEARRRGAPIAVVGVPKTIDNDILLMDKSFGFETAFAAAVESIRAAHTEALGVRNGVGLVKLMGRHCGYIACSAALATGEANFVLVPEVPFQLEGHHGFLEMLRRRVEARRHAVIVAAEGAGQDLMPGGSPGLDVSGNLKLKDIGPFLQERIRDHFRGRSVDLNLKYIDPSYLIRSVPASPQDRLYCSRLAQYAVHAAMAGKTGLVVGRWHGHYVHIPIDVVTSGRRQVDPKGDLWRSVLESTGQPARML